VFPADDQAIRFGSETYCSYGAAILGQVISDLLGIYGSFAEIK
jgi:hypothetical protein